MAGGSSCARPREYRRIGPPTRPKPTSRRLCGRSYGLDHLEALEFGMAQVKRAVAAGVAMRQPECLRSRPRLEIRPAAPACMRRIQRVVLALGAAQQMEGQEARNIAQLRIAPRPDLFEIGFRATDDLEAIHRDEHRPAVLANAACTMPR